MNSNKPEAPVTSQISFCLIDNVGPGNGWLFSSTTFPLKVNGQSLWACTDIP